MDERNPIFGRLGDDFQHSRLVEEELDDLGAPPFPLQLFHDGQDLRFRDRIRGHRLGILHCHQNTAARLGIEPWQDGAYDCESRELGIISLVVLERRRERYFGRMRTWGEKEKTENECNG